MVLSNIISVVSDNIFYICIYSGTPLDIKKSIVLHTLPAYNSLLIRHKVYSSDPMECFCTQPEGMLKSMKTLVLIQHHVERIL